MAYAEWEKSNTRIMPPEKRVKMLLELAQNIQPEQYEAYRVLQETLKVIGGITKRDQTKSLFELEAVTRTGYALAERTIGTNKPGYILWTPLAGHQVDIPSGKLGEVLEVFDATEVSYPYNTTPVVQVQLFHLQTLAPALDFFDEITNAADIYGQDFNDFLRAMQIRYEREQPHAK